MSVSCRDVRFVQHAGVRSPADLTGLNSSSEVWILAPSTLKAKNKSLMFEIYIAKRILEINIEFYVLA